MSFLFLLFPVIRLEFRQISSSFSFRMQHIGRHCLLYELRKCEQRLRVSDAFGRWERLAHELGKCDEFFWVLDAGLEDGILAVQTPCFGVPD